MNSKMIHINGAAGVLGDSFRQSFEKTHPHNQFELADMNSTRLNQIASEMNGKVRGLIIGNMFDPESVAYAAVTESEAEIVAWVAAKNLDAHEPVSERPHLRNQENACLERRIRTLLEQSRQRERKLLIVVNSITAIFGEEIDTAKGIAEKEHWHYPLMKGDQHRMLMQYREELFAKGIDLSVLYPGAFRSRFTDPDQALKLANGMGKKVRGYRGRENLKQQRILEPHEITDAVAKVAAKWSKGERIPDDEEHGKRNSRQEWVMLNPDDLIVEGE